MRPPLLTFEEAVELQFQLGDLFLDLFVVVVGVVAVEDVLTRPQTNPVVGGLLGQVIDGRLRHHRCFHATGTNRLHHLVLEAQAGPRSDAPS